jgi:hypothetical protein
LAVAGFVLGLIGTLIGWVPFTFFVAWVLGVLAIVFGAIGFARTQQTPPRRHRGLAIAGLCLGVGALGMGAIGAALTNRIVDELDGRLFVNDPANSEIHQEACSVEQYPLGRAASQGLSASQAYASGTITNRRADYESFRVRVELLAPSGTRVGTAFDYLLSIAPGETRRWEAVDVITGTFSTLTCVVSTS